MKFERASAVLCLIALLFPTASAFATLTIIVVNPEVVFIGADGLRSSSTEWSTVCKAHEIYGGVLVKYGLDQDFDKTFSSDMEIQKLVKTSKTFERFRQKASTKLAELVEKSLAENRPDGKASNPGKVDGDIFFRPMSPQSILGLEMGLIFVDVNNGKLRVEELTLAPQNEPVVGPFGATWYRWVVKPGEWKIRTSEDGPLTHSPLPKNVTDFLLEDPIHKIPTTIARYEHVNPCHYGIPNLFLKITPAMADPRNHYSKAARKKLLHTASIQYSDHGSCPSWEVRPVSRPEGCPVS